MSSFSFLPCVRHCNYSFEDCFMNKVYFLKKFKCCVLFIVFRTPYSNAKSITLIHSFCVIFNYSYLHVFLSFIHIFVWFGSGGGVGAQIVLKDPTWLWQALVAFQWRIIMSLDRYKDTEYVSRTEVTHILNPRVLFSFTKL